MATWIKQNYQCLGLGSVLYVEMAKRILARGYSHAEMSWVAEDNLMMNRAARLLGARYTRLIGCIKRHYNDLV